MGVFRHPWRRRRRAKLIPSKLSAGIVQIGKVNSSGRLSPFGLHPNKVLGTGVPAVIIPFRSSSQGGITETGKRIAGNTIDERGARIIGGLVNEYGERVIQTSSSAGEITYLIGQVESFGDVQSLQTIQPVTSVGITAPLTPVHNSTPQQILGSGLVRTITPVRIKAFGQFVGTGQVAGISPQGTTAVFLIKVIGQSTPTPIAFTLETPNWGELTSETLLAYLLTSFTEEVGYNDPEVS